MVEIKNINIGMNQTQTDVMVEIKIESVISIATYIF
jgi:hypothetical protein